MVPAPARRSRFPEGKHGKGELKYRNGLPVCPTLALGGAGLSEPDAPARESRMVADVSG
jgi:hypothetical protein